MQIFSGCINFEYNESRLSITLGDAGDGTRDRFEFIKYQKNQ
jgi:hypothetical protein